MQYNIMSSIQQSLDDSSNCLISFPLLGSLSFGFYHILAFRPCLTAGALTRSFPCCGRSSHRALGRTVASGRRRRD